MQGGRGQNVLPFSTLIMWKGLNNYFPSPEEAIDLSSKVHMFVSIYPSHLFCFGFGLGVLKVPPAFQNNAHQSTLRKDQTNSVDFLFCFKHLLLR